MSFVATMRRQGSFNSGSRSWGCSLTHLGFHLTHTKLNTLCFWDQWLSKNENAPSPFGTSNLWWHSKPDGANKFHPAVSLRSIFNQNDRITCCILLIYWLGLILAVEDPFLVVVRDSIIYGISLNPEDKSNDAMVPVAGLQNGYDVDFDDNEQIIYWVEHPVWYVPKNATFNI